MENANKLKKIFIKNGKIRMLALVCVLTVLALLLSNIGTTLARYVIGMGNDGIAVAKPFYFSSNTLKNGYTRVTRDAANNVDVEIDFRNYIDNLRINDGQIDYSFSIELITGSQRESFFSDSGSFSGGSAGEFKNTYTIPAEKITNSTTILVSVTGIQAADNNVPNGYTKTLTERFGFSESVSMVDYEINQYDGMVEILVGGAASNDEIILTWAEGFTPGPLTEIQIVSTGTNTLTFEATQGVVHKIFFYQNNPGAVYNLGDFSVSVG